MTREEVMAMTDEQLRFKASELMGITDGAIPDYPNDIAAAWALAEREGISVISVEKEWWAGKFDGSNGDWWFGLGPIENESAARAITQTFIIVIDTKSI